MFTKGTYIRMKPEATTRMNEIAKLLGFGYAFQSQPYGVVMRDEGEPTVEVLWYDAELTFTETHRDHIEATP